MDVSRGRRGGSWQRVSRACVCKDVSRGSVAGVGDRGSACPALDRMIEGWRFRVAGVGLRMHVSVWEDAGRWIRLAGVVNRAF